MKKIILSTLTLFTIILSAQAGEKRINLYGGYVFDDKFDYVGDYSYTYYHGTIKGGFQYGAGLEFMVQPQYGVELLWFGQTTTAPTTYDDNYLFVKNTNFDLNLNYAMIGGVRHMMKEGSKVEGYGGFMLGALFADVKNPDNGGSSSGTKFAWGLRLGGNIWASDKVGVKIQGQLLSAVQSVGGSLYFGTGGAGAGVSVYSSMLQFSFSSGLVFRIGK